MQDFNNFSFAHVNEVVFQAHVQETQPTQTSDPLHVVHRCCEEINSLAITCFGSNFQIDTQHKAKAATVLIASASTVPSPNRSFQVVDLLLKHHELTLSSTDIKNVDLNCGEFLNALAEFGRVRRHPLPWSLALDSKSLFYRFISL